MSGTKETKEVIEALATIAAKTIKNLKDDGKISIWEILTYGSDMTSVKAAIAGSGDLLKELSDLDEEETNDLRNLIISKLDDFGISPRNVDISDRFLKWLFDTADMVQDIRNQPPTAEKV